MYLVKCESTEWLEESEQCEERFLDEKLENYLKDKNYSCYQKSFFGHSMSELLSQSPLYVNNEAN